MATGRQGMKGASQCFVLRREARVREFIVVARVTIFKWAPAGKPNEAQFIRGFKFIALVTAIRPETKRTNPGQDETPLQGGGGPTPVLVYLLG